MQCPSKHALEHAAYTYPVAVLNIPVTAKLSNTIGTSDSYMFPLTTEYSVSFTMIVPAPLS